MVLARIGIPAGLRSQTWQLVELRQRKKIAFFQSQLQELQLYLTGMEPGEARHLALDLVAYLPGRTNGAASRAYPYYSNDRISWAEPLRVQVTH